MVSWSAYCVRKAGYCAGTTFLHEKISGSMREAGNSGHKAYADIEVVHILNTTEDFSGDPPFDPRNCWALFRVRNKAPNLQRDESKDWKWAFQDVLGLPIYLKKRKPSHELPSDGWFMHFYIAPGDPEHKQNKFGHFFVVAPVDALTQKLQIEESYRTAVTAAENDIAQKLGLRLAPQRPAHSLLGLKEPRGLKALYHDVKNTFLWQSFPNSVPFNIM